MSDTFDSDLSLAGSEARTFFVNFTSSLIQVNATLLAAALVIAAIIGAAAVAIYYLWLESQNQSSGYGSSGYGYGSSNSYGYARSAQEGYDFSALNIIQWITMLTEMYEKFDFNDLDCQKRVICEVMKEPEYYGTVAQQFKSGFQYAKYLEVLSLPDDLRELLDEYLDANSRADQDKDCSDFYQCPYSIKDAVDKYLGNQK